MSDTDIDFDDTVISDDEDCACVDDLHRREADHSDRGKDAHVSKQKSDCDDPNMMLSPTYIGCGDTFGPGIYVRLEDIGTTEDREGATIGDSGCIVTTCKEARVNDSSRSETKHLRFPAPWTAVPTSSKTNLSEPGCHPGSNLGMQSLLSENVFDHHEPRSLVQMQGIKNMCDEDRVAKDRQIKLGHERSPEQYTKASSPELPRTRSPPPYSVAMHSTHFETPDASYGTIEHPTYLSKQDCQRILHKDAEQADEGVAQFDIIMADMLHLIAIILLTAIFMLLLIGLVDKTVGRAM